MAIGNANNRYTNLVMVCVYELTFAYPFVYHLNIPRDKNLEIANKH